MRRGSADGDAAAAAEVEQALVAELPERPQDCVAVDLENRSEVSRGRKALARTRLGWEPRRSDLDTIIRTALAWERRAGRAPS